MSEAAPALAPERRAVTELHTAAEIGALLGRAQHSRGMLALSAGGVSSSSVLLAVDARNGWLYLDEPFPALAALRQGVLLHVSARLDGGSFEFRTRFDQFLDLHGAAAARVAFPTLLLHYERRHSFRLSIPAGYALPPVLLRSTDGAIQGRIVDLSQFGAATLVGLAFETTVGTQMVCQLCLPNTRLFTGVEVRSRFPQVGSQRLGLMFASLGADEEAKISAAISLIQRQLIRTTASRA
jgi:c-di-GMP-binding flagellar brake protein YcgR